MKQRKIRKITRKKPNRRLRKSRKRTNRPKKTKRKTKTKKPTKKRKGIIIIKGGGGQLTQKKKNIRIRTLIDDLFLSDTEIYQKEMRELIQTIYENIKDVIIKEAITKENINFSKQLRSRFDVLNSYLKFTDDDTQNRNNKIEFDIYETQKNIEKQSKDFLEEKYTNYNTKTYFTSGLGAIMRLITRRGDEFRKIGTWLYYPNGNGTIDGTNSKLRTEGRFSTKEYWEHYRTHPYYNSLSGEDETIIHKFIDNLRVFVTEFNNLESTKELRDKIKSLKKEKTDLETISTLYFPYFNAIKSKNPDKYDDLINLINQLKPGNDVTFLDDLRSEI